MKEDRKRRRSGRSEGEFLLASSVVWRRAVLTWRWTDRSGLKEEDSSRERKICTMGKISVCSPLVGGDGDKLGLRRGMVVGREQGEGSQSASAASR